jgi:hypothetical protein
MLPHWIDMGELELFIDFGNLFMLDL